MAGPLPSVARRVRRHRVAHRLPPDPPQSGLSLPDHARPDVRLTGIRAATTWAEAGQDPATWPLLHNVVHIRGRRRIAPPEAGWPDAVPGLATIRVELAAGFLDSPLGTSNVPLPAGVQPYADLPSATADLLRLWRTRRRSAGRGLATESLSAGRASISWASEIPQIVHQTLARYTARGAQWY